MSRLLRQWFGLLALAGLVAALVLAVQDNFSLVSLTENSRSGSAALTPVASLSREAVPLEPPTIQSERLWADLEALSFERFTEDDRRQASQYLQNALTTAGWVPTLQPFEHGVNILAVRPGTDPNAGTLLLGAHYDTVDASPGADDNATAVAAVLEIARLFADHPTPRTLEIALFDMEEVGLVGSEFLAAQRAIASPPLDGAIILEMLGYACHQPGCQSYPPLLPDPPDTDVGNFLAAIADQDHAALLTPFTQPASANLPPVFTLAVPLLGPFTPEVLRSDHASFWGKGIGAVMVTDTADYRNPHYHQPSDLPHTLDQEFYLGAVQVVVDALNQLLYRSGSFEF
jgi:hypothetical protein